VINILVEDCVAYCGHYLVDHGIHIGVLGLMMRKTAICEQTFGSVDLVFQLGKIVQIVEPVAALVAGCLSSGAAHVASCAHAIGDCN